jgi:CII-binding regulator of phage lambda lysogenization HflD
MNYVDKQDLLQTIDGIYESLWKPLKKWIQMREKDKRLKEIKNNLRVRLSHLRNIINMIMIPAKIIQTKKNVKKIGMTIEQWNDYLEQSTTASTQLTEDMTHPRIHKKTRRKIRL